MQEGEGWQLSKQDMEITGIFRNSQKEIILERDKEKRRAMHEPGDKKGGNKKWQKKLKVGRILDFRFQSILLRKMLKVMGVRMCACM